MNPLYERPTVAEVVESLTAIAAMLPFFPQDNFALAVVAEDVHRFVGTREQLDWFHRQCRACLSTWDGVPALRALFCTKYAPFDGMLPIVEFPGMEEDRLEADFRRRELEENERRLERYRREALLAPPEDRAPFQLPEPQPMPEIPKQIAAGAVSLSAGAQIEQVQAAIKCNFCGDGRRRVRSNRTGAYVHTDTEVGRVPCKVKGPRDGDEVDDVPAEDNTTITGGGLGSIPPAQQEGATNGD